MKLVWNDLEQGWECSGCGALYSSDEVQRVFEYDKQIPKNFCTCYCMDCGCRWDDIEMED